MRYAERPPQTVKTKTVRLARVRVTHFFSLKTFQPFILTVIRLYIRRLRMNGLDFKPVIQPFTTLHNGRKARDSRFTSQAGGKRHHVRKRQAHLRHFSLSPSKIFLSA